MIPVSAERLLMKFEDGPLARIGVMQVSNEGRFSWPLPDRLATLSHLDHVERVAFWDADDPDRAIADGLPELIVYSPNTVVYKKVAESDLPPQPCDSSVARGVTYEVEV